MITYPYATVREKPHIFENLHSASADSTVPSVLQVADFKIPGILNFAGVSEYHCR